MVLAWPDSYAVRCSVHFLFNWVHFMSFRGSLKGLVALALGVSWPWLGSQGSRISSVVSRPLTLPSSISCFNSVVEVVF